MPGADGKMMWAAMCAAFFGFMRTGEFTVTEPGSMEKVVALADVAVDNREDPQWVNIHLRSSKMDQFGEGATISFARNHSELCPVAALLAYIAVRPTVAGPLFLCDNGSPLTKANFVQKLHQILTTAGIDPTYYKGHSFRIGAATSAAAAGIPDSTIQKLGRWSSNAFQSYIRTPPAELAKVASQLGSIV